MRVALPLVVAGALFAFGCPDRPAAPPVPVDPNALVRAYRDTPSGASGAWDRVRVQLVVPTYKVFDWGVGWESGLPGAEPVIRFTGPPPETPGPLLVVGTCRGVVRDGLKRGPGVHFYVLVENCTFTPHAGAPAGPPPKSTP